MQAVGSGWLHHDTEEYMRPQQRVKDFEPTGGE